MAKRNRFVMTASLLVIGAILFPVTAVAMERSPEVSSVELGIQIRIEAEGVTWTGYLVLSDDDQVGLGSQMIGSPQLGIGAPSQASQLIDLARRGLAAAQVLARIALGLI